MMRFTDIPSAIIESRFTPPPHPWRFQPESCVKRHEISTNTFPVQQCTFSCDKGRPARSSSKNTMEKFILVVKSVSKRQSEKPGGQKEDSVKAQQHFLLKDSNGSRLKWEIERQNPDRLQASVGTLLTATGIKMGISILKAVQDTQYFNTCSEPAL